MVQASWNSRNTTVVRIVRDPREASETSLRTLSFTTWSREVSLIKYTEVNAFQPLLALHGLETLVLELHFYNLDDETLIKWANAWPNLKTFKVSMTSVKNLITLRGVKALLQHCRDLKTLTLSFDASELDSIPEIPSTPSLRHGLKDWDIAISLVTPDTLGPVIAILSWVFFDMWDVKSRSTAEFDIELEDSEVLPHTLGRVARRDLHHDG